MKLMISGKEKLMSESVAHYVMQRFQAALDRFASSIRRVRIRLEDLNGPRRGIDKRCAVMVQLKPGSTVTVEATADDAYTAIAWAAQRAKIRVGRCLERSRI